MDKNSKKKLWFMNSVFVLICGGILVFLLRAPEETTSALPKDEDHINLHTIQGKKEAEKYCGECHDVDKIAPLPDGHPPKYRCLFCHKRN